MDPLRIDQAGNPGTGARERISNSVPGTAVREGVACQPDQD